MKSPYHVIERPIFTEKSTTMYESLNKYTFKVDKRANKVEIRLAVEEIFKVKVTKVNTSMVRGKPKRFRWSWGKTPEWKKAIVTLAEGSSIDMSL